VRAEVAALGHDEEDLPCATEYLGVSLRTAGDGRRFDAPGAAIFAAAGAAGHGASLAQLGTG
jgi:hypothetical protein